jgi:hypothetical protein
MKFSRLAVIIYPVIMWLLAQSYFIWPELLYTALGVSVAITLLLTFLLRSPEREASWWLLALLPISFTVAITAYISLQSSWLVVQLLFLVLAIFLFNYFKSIYYFYHRLDLYKEEDNTIIKAYGSFLVVFFGAADLYGLQSLLSLTVWPMFLVFSLIILIVAYLNLNLDNFDRKVIIQFSAIITLLITEMALVFIFLPLSYNVAALSVGIIYYLFINMTRLYLQKALTPKKIKLYLIISYAGLAILLLTARWLN